MTNDMFKNLSRSICYLIVTIVFCMFMRCAEAPAWDSPSVDKYGNDICGISVDHDTLDVHGNVTVTGNRSISLFAGDNSTVHVEGDVSIIGEGEFIPPSSMLGYGSHGIYTTDSKVTVGGSVTASGDRSTALYAENSTVTILGGVSISGDGIRREKEGYSSCGVNAVNSTVYVGGDISTSGMTNIGINAAGGTVTVDGKIRVDGATSTGAFASDYSTVYLNNDIIVTGNSTRAACAYNNSDVYISGDVSVTGGGTVRGLDVTNGGVVNVSGDVTVEGRNAAYGITASGNTSVINIDGDLSASAPVDIRTVDVYGATVNINGNVSAKGNDNQRGGLHETIAAFLGGKVNVSGDVSTEGQGMIAAYSQNDSLIRVSGNVTASGKRSFATLAWSYGSIDITGDVSARGDLSFGAFAWDSSSIDITGNVMADGAEAWALYAANNSAIKVNGNISASGDEAVGAVARGSGSVISISNGTMDMNGSDTLAMLVNAGGSITLDDAVVNANGSALLLSTSSYGSVNASNGSALYGAVTNNTSDSSYAGNSLDLTLREGASLTGTVDDLGTEAATNLYIMDTNAAWRVTGNSMFRGTLANGGVIDYTASAGLTAVTVGNLADAGSTGGLFRMKTDIVNQKADNLIVTGTASGSYLIDVINNGSGATTGKEVVPLVYIGGGGDEDFSLAHPVELGVWEYSLRETSTGTVSSVWELYANGNVTNPGVGGLDSFIGAYLLSYAETNTLIQRLGDLRGTKSESGLWFRLHGGEFESKSRRYSKGFDMDYYGIQLGYDRKVEIGWDGNAYFGVMFGYGKGDIDYPNNGGGDVESKMAGIYGTFVKPNGFFLDAIIKYQWMENDFDVPDSAGTMVHGKGADSNGFGWSVEVGQRIPFGRGQKTGWYAEPQVQLTYQRFGSGYYTASNGLHIGMEGLVSMTGRLGLLVGYEKENSNLYAKVSRVREFEGDLDVYANGSKLSESLSGSWWVYGIGYTARFDDRNSIYLDIERSSGGSFRHNWAAKAGWRYTF